MVIPYVHVSKGGANLFHLVTALLALISGRPLPVLLPIASFRSRRRLKVCERKLSCRVEIVLKLDLNRVGLKLFLYYIGSTPRPRKCN